MGLSVPASGLRGLYGTIFSAMIITVALAILLFLGFWQLDRLDEKTRLIAALEAGLAQQIQPLPRHLGDDLEALRFHRYRLTGVYDYSRERHLHAIHPNYGPGYALVTPLRRDDAPTAMVIRGFVPTLLKEASTRPETLVAGPVTLLAMVRLPTEGNRFTPSDDVAANIWYRRDLRAMAGGDRGAYLPVFFQRIAAPGEVRAFPIAFTPQIAIVNNHFSYALTWFGIAACLIGVVLLRYSENRVRRKL